eukprot:CAMPEP_0178663512 /NCGR_PEP_ID=MMETSP0698-20121128/28864_1 /TAXON_ID=265572 /ORGANISM="Extubocellulus spinifer, Strain CCMP396" /LENGTH=73 /DNA_ID=CAMNT_0020306573 /DNA_START=389 /DNA_END=610 /DNA_ORIENTATION=-
MYNGNISFVVDFCTDQAWGRSSPLELQPLCFTSRSLSKKSTTSIVRREVTPVASGLADSLASFNSCAKGNTLT